MKNNKMTKKDAKKFILEMYSYFMIHDISFIENYYSQFMKDNTDKSFMEVDKDFWRWVYND